MKKVVTLALLFLNSISFGMQGPDERAVDDVQRLRQLAEEKEKRSEQREQEKLELRRQELELERQKLAFRHQLLSLQEREVRNSKVIVCISASRILAGRLSVGDTERFYSELTNFFRELLSDDGFQSSSSSQSSSSTE